jgi:predicted Zn-dependent peptidase
MIMVQSTINCTTLSNGLRVVTDRVDSVDSVAVGIWANVGARHEQLAHNGAAHMVEHMMFKGTPTRDAKKLAEIVDDVGGHMNAFTSREMTAYFMHLLKHDLDLALDVLSDIIQRATLPEEEIERERGVILSEIGLSQDTPDDMIFDEWQVAAFPDQTLGAPILGRADNVKAMTRDDLVDFIKTNYKAGNLTISAAGAVDHEAFVQKVERLFTELPEGGYHEDTPGAYTGGEYRNERDLEQTHLILGYEGLPRSDADYDAARAMSTILGEGMSSRLFQEIREKRGLVYSISSLHLDYTDTGLFGVYAGTDPDSVSELMPVVCDETRKMFHDVTEAEVARAKAQLRAGFLMNRESMLSRAHQQAKSLKYFNQSLDVDERLRQIDAIDKDQIIRAARRIFTGSQPTLAAVGPLQGLTSLDEINHRLAAA